MDVCTIAVLRVGNRFLDYCFLKKSAVQPPNSLFMVTATALQLMDAIRSSFTYDLINRTGSKCLSLSFAEVTKAMGNCKVSFHETMHECLQAIKMEATEMPKEDAIEAVRQKIMKKVFHARSNVEFQDYKSENIGRYAKKESFTN